MTDEKEVSVEQMKEERAEMQSLLDSRFNWLLIWFLAAVVLGLALAYNLSKAATFKSDVLIRGCAEYRLNKTTGKHYLHWLEPQTTTATIYVPSVREVVRWKDRYKLIDNILVDLDTGLLWQRYKPADIFYTDSAIGGARYIDDAAFTDAITQ